MEEPESTADSQGESPFAEVRSPRLSIWHLMLWTFCTAVYLSLMRAFNPIQSDLPNALESIRNLSSVIQAIFTGATIVGAIVLVTTRIRNGPPMLRQPGHWLLFVSAVVHLAYFPSMILLLSQGVSISQPRYLVFCGLNYLIPTIAYAFAARHSRAFRWKLIFVGFVVLDLSLCFFCVGKVMWNSIPSFGNLVLAGAVLVVSIVDLVTGVRRDWLHWVGVTTYVAGSSVVLLWVIGSWFVR